MGRVVGQSDRVPHVEAVKQQGHSMLQPECVGKEVPLLILNDVAQAIVQVTLDTVRV